MESFFIYLLKSSSILVLFLMAYHLFLKRETFFTSNRLFLILGLAASFVFPFVTITKTIYVERSPMLSEVSEITTTMIPNLDSTPAFNWFSILFLVYALGILYFSFRLIYHIHTIQKIKKNGNVLAKDSCYHVRTDKRISPFSFFKHIFYYPNQFSNRELNTILNHEQVHVRQLHSFDILFIEIIFILQWFNPAVWFYKTALKQNLEFIADSEACGLSEDRKAYQYLMLKQTLGNHKITIANPFFNSLIKKRIVMLNQSKSKRVNLLKLFLVLPFLGLFLVGFNTKEVVKFNETEPSHLLIEEPSVEFTSPVKAEDIKRVSSNFGPAKSPFTHTMQFHNGIDLVASPGTDVMASADGKVEISAKSEENGNYLVIKHKDAYSTKYMHLKDRSVKAGDKVTKGQVIGHVGSTGKSTGPHLHFEVLKFKKAINPTSLIPFKTADKFTSPKKTEKEKKVEFVISKNTTDSELKKMKQDLAKDNVDFSYTVVHNDAREIIDISVEVSGKGENGSSFKNSYNASDDDGISPLVIFIDKANNLVSIGSKGSHKSGISKINSNSNQVWISSGDTNSKEIVIKKENGTNKVFINGEEKEIDEEFHEKNVSISVNGSSDTDSNTSIVINEGSENDSNVKVISKSDNSFKFTTTGSGNPLFVIDGKKSNEEALKKLAPSEIESINVLKGEVAEKKYGKDAKDGVVEITTKEKN